jgi:hypothetical protein
VNQIAVSIRPVPITLAKLGLQRVVLPLLHAVEPRVNLSAASNSIAASNQMVLSLIALLELVTVNRVRLEAVD